MRPIAVQINFPPPRPKTNEASIGRKLPGEGGAEVYTHVGRRCGRCQVERSLSAYTGRCVSGPGLEAAGLLHCSRWRTIFFFSPFIRRTLHVGSKEEVLSSSPHFSCSGSHQLCVGTRCREGGVQFNIFLWVILSKCII